jgi:hypothetical protein
VATADSVARDINNFAACPGYTEDAAGLVRRAYELTDVRDKF